MWYPSHNKSCPWPCACFLMQNTFYWTAIPAKLPTVPTLSKSFNVKSLLRLKLWTHCLCCFLSLLLLLFYLSGLPVLWPSVGFPISGRIHADMERKDIAKQEQNPAGEMFSITVPSLAAGGGARSCILAGRSPRDFLPGPCLLVSCSFPWRDFHLADPFNF